MGGWYSKVLVDEKKGTTRVLGGSTKQLTIKKKDVHKPKDNNQN